MNDLLPHDSCRMEKHPVSPAKLGFGCYSHTAALISLHINVHKTSTLKVTCLIHLLQIGGGYVTVNHVALVLV